MSFIRRFVDRLDSVADSDADPALLHGRLRSRRSERPLVLDEPQPRPPEGIPLPMGPIADGSAGPAEPRDEATEAREVLAKITADQRRRMRGRGELFRPRDGGR